MVSPPPLAHPPAVGLMPQPLAQPVQQNPVLMLSDPSLVENESTTRSSGFNMGVSPVGRWMDAPPGASAERRVPSTARTGLRICRGVHGVEHEGGAAAGRSPH